MDQQDIQFVSYISAWVRRFPEAWQTYQDWLNDIIAAQPGLKQQYSPWPATIIFRWRLVYFMIYVTSVILISYLSQKLTMLFNSPPSGKFPMSSEQVSVERDNASLKSPISPRVLGRYRYVLQRTATLLAMAELTLCCIAAFTGVLIAFYYQPTALGAHESLATIAHHITSGTLILSLHHIAGSGLIIVALIQLTILFLGREFLLTWLTGWISGILLALTAMGLSWTAVVLNWEQTNFWRFKIELNIIGTLPVVGPTLQAILSGGSGINTLTLQHMYTLHSYVLAIATIFLSIIHLIALTLQEQTWKPEDQRFSLAKLSNKPASKVNS